VEGPGRDNIRGGNSPSRNRFLGARAFGRAPTLGRIVVATHIPSRTAPPEGPSRAPDPPAPPPTARGISGRPPPPPPARRPLLPPPPPEQVISLLSPPPPSEAPPPPQPRPERVISLLSPPPPEAVRPLSPPPPPEKIISLLPPPPPEAVRPLSPPPPPEKIISLLPPPPPSKVRTPAPPPPSRSELHPRPAAVTSSTPRIPTNGKVQPSLRPRLDRYAQERLRKARGAFAALMILIALFLACGGTVGYLVAARQDSQAHVDSLIEIIAWQRDQLENGSADVTTGSTQDQGESEVETSGAPGLIDALSGSGSATTDIVSTRGPWRLEWTGDDVFVFVKQAENGRLVHADGGQGSGSFVIPEGGRFILDVLARGTWSIRVVRS
jgi:hypothetical protein